MRYDYRSIKNISSIGFTVVELIVVVTVLSIIGSLIVVSYSGVVNRAKAAAIQSDLSTASKQLNLFQTENDAYPETVDCGQPNSSTNLCIKTSDGANVDYSVNNSVTPRTYSLTVSDGDVSYYITQNSSPAETPAEVASAGILLAAGGYHSCAIFASNNTYCWGLNGNGQIGDGTSGANRLIPTLVPNTGALAGLTIKSISGGKYFTCALASDNNAYCWGINDYGQLGNGTSGANQTAPVPVVNTGALNGLTVKAIVAGGYHACVIASDDNAYCWGANDYGQVGDSSSGTNRTSPVKVTNTGVLAGLTVKSIVAGDAHTCIIASDDNAYCWGYNSSGQVGDSTSGTNRTSPRIVTRTGNLNGLTIKSIAAGGYHTCVVASDDNAYCWGNNLYGQIGDSTSLTNRTAAAIVTRTGNLNGLTIKSIAVGMWHSCAIASDNNAYCWGHNNYGQVGDGTSGTDRTAARIVIRTGVLLNKTLTAVEAGDGHSCVTDSSNYYCWGYNNGGQDGDNSSGTNRTSPVLVSSP